MLTAGIRSAARSGGAVCPGLTSRIWRVRKPARRGQDYRSPSPAQHWAAASATRSPTITAVLTARRSVSVPLNDDLPLPPPSGRPGWIWGATQYPYSGGRLGEASFGLVRVACPALSDQTSRMSTTFASSGGEAPVDPELRTVRYAFDAAFLRFRRATDDDSWMAELSNMLHHLYRLRMLCIERLADFEQQIEPSLGWRFRLLRTSTAGISTTRLTLRARSYRTRCGLRSTRWRP